VEFPWGRDDIAGRDVGYVIVRQEPDGTVYSVDSHVYRLINLAHESVDGGEVTRTVGLPWCLNADLAIIFSRSPSL